MYNDANTKFKLVHIPPVSLLMYDNFNRQRAKLFNSKFTLADKLKQQNELETHITIINSNISEMNCSSNLHSVRWDRDVMRFKSKKRGRNQKYKKSIKSFCYKEFYDGVHANHSLKKKWFSYMLESSDKDCSQTPTQSSNTHHSDTSSDDDDDDDNTSSSWDFKRIKKVSHP